MIGTQEQTAVLTLDRIGRCQELLIAKGRSANTVKAYGSDWRNFLTTMGSSTAGISILNESDFDFLAVSYLNSIRTSQSSRTVNRKRSSLLTLSKIIGVRAPLLNEYSTPTGSKLTAHPLPEGMEGVRRIIAMAPTIEQQVMIAFCGLAGLRISESRAVLPHDVRRKDADLFVRGKGDKDRIVPMSPELLEWVTPLLAMRMIEADKPLVRLKDRQAREAITLCGRRAGISRRVASHDLRSTFATAVLEKTSNVRLVQELLGHASVTTTELYTQVGNDTLRKAVELP